MSQYPPPFTPPARKSNNTVLIVVLCVVVGLCLVCGLGAFLLGKNLFDKTTPFVGCIVNMSAARNGILDYAKANDGTLPKAESWQDDVKPYVGKYLTKGETGPFKVMDPNGEWYCEGDNGKKTGIAYNSDIAGKKLSDIQNQNLTVAVFEIEAPSHNANEPYKQRDPRKTSPKLFGDNRGWFFLCLKGDNIGGMEGNHARASASASTSTDKEPDTNSDSDK